MEDDFDLDLYIKEQTEKTFFKKLQEKSKKMSNIVKIMLIIVSFITAYTIYSYASYLIELWRTNRINETARDITEQLDVREQPAPIQDTAQAHRAISQEKIPITPTPSLMPAIINLRDAFKNDDIVAYLKINDSKIDFPVVLTDNNDYYLERDLYKQNNAAGSAFMDFENQIYPLGLNTVIYAHNMRNGSMFHNIRYYDDEEYFNSHKTISLQTLYENTLWEIFSFYETDIEFFYNKTTFSDVNEFLAFADHIKEKSQYPSNVVFNGNIRILTLSTCTNRDADSRYVIHAYQVKKGS